MYQSSFPVIIATFLLSSTVIALPTNVERAAAAAPTCKVTTATFDELGSSGGESKALPGNGYNYKGLNIESSQWGWVSKGWTLNGDTTDDDRKVDDVNKGQRTNIITHSGNNALMPSADGFSRIIDSADYSGGHRYYDLRSLWIAPEIAGKAFNFRIDCRSYYEKDNKSKTWAVPALATGQMYQIKLPSDWTHMWRCTLGATNLQQFILDDFEYCLWDFPYATPIPW